VHSRKPKENNGSGFGYRVSLRNLPVYSGSQIPESISVWGSSATEFLLCVNPLSSIPFPYVGLAFSLLTITAESWFIQATHFTRKIIDIIVGFVYWKENVTGSNTF